MLRILLDPIVSFITDFQVGEKHTQIIRPNFRFDTYSSIGSAFLAPGSAIPLESMQVVLSPPNLVRYLLRHNLKKNHRL